MEFDDRLSRRRALEMSGIAATALLAGCSESGPGAGDGNDTEGSDGQDGTEGDQSRDLDPEAWEDVDEIVLEGQTSGWTGVEPGVIEGEHNPALLLEEGREYEISFENVDGEPHNIALWTEENEPVEDYETELAEQEGETQTLAFEALPEIGEYVCEPHTDSMRGPVEFVGEDEGGEGGENGTESG